MVAITLTGEVVTDVSRTDPQSLTFIVRCREENSLPLHFDVSCSASHEAAKIARGTRILMVGRLTAGGQTKKVTLVATSFEILGTVNHGTTVQAQGSN
jgi:hypothetical protein